MCVSLWSIRAVSQSGQRQLQDEPLQEQSTESRGDETQERGGGHPAQETETRTTGIRQNPSSPLIRSSISLVEYFQRGVLCTQERVEFKVCYHFSHWQLFKRRNVDILNEEEAMSESPLVDSYLSSPATVSLFFPCLSRNKGRLT